MIGSLQNESLFQSMFQLTSEGVLVVDNTATILLANPACENLFGIDSDDLLGRSLDTLITSKNREQLIKYIINLKKTRTNKNFEILGVKNDGKEFNLEIKLTSSIIDGKNLIITFLRDVTNRTENLLEIKQTNDKLIESNQKFDSLISNIKGILFRCKNNKDYTMHYISEGCLEITGHPFNDFKNANINYGQLIIEADCNNVWEHIQTAVKQKKTFDCKHRIQHKNGSIKYVWVKGEAVYNQENNGIDLVGFITDITAYKEQEFTIKTNEVKMRALLDAIPDMMFIQDHQGNYLDWYAKNSKKLFTGPEKFIGLNMKDVLPISVYKKIKTSYKDLLASGNLQIAEYSIEGKKGIEHYEARVVHMNDNKLLTIVRDVTKEREKDEQLNIKNNALASASNSIIISDAQKRNTPIIYCNDAFEKITGYSKKEVYGKNCNFLQKDDRDQVEINVMKKAIAGGKACRVVLRNYRKDGTLFWNDVTITPVRNNKNKLTHFIGVQNDVTNKVRAVDLKDRIQKILELIAQDKPLKSITKKIIDTAEIYLKDCMGSISILDKVDKTLHILVAPNLPKTFCNFIDGTVISPKAGTFGAATFLKREVIASDIETNVYCEGYKHMALKNGLKACWSFPIMSSIDDVLGVLSFYSSLARKPFANEKEMLLDMTYLASIAIEKHNNLIVLKEGKKQLEIYAQKLEEKVKERTEEVMATVKELVVTNLNLKDQIQIAKQAESETIISKSITTAIAKNFPKGLIVVINKDFQLVLAEGEALDQLGFKSLVFEGMNLDDLSFFAEERKKIISEYIFKTLSGIHLSFELEYKNRYFSVNTAPLFDENNQVTNALMVYNDISEQKEIEFRIQNALKKEQELNQLKSRFISTASHEFRTPLSAILTSAILIRKQNGYGTEVKREKYVLQIEQNVNHLITILNDFLSLSKLEEGKTKAVKEHFEIIHFVKILINESKVTLKKEQQISFNSSLLHLIVNLDAKLLRRIITNLISNASKYSVVNSIINIKIDKNKDKVLIEIKDSGIGIPQEEQDQLFNRFFRANNAINIEGTGLGLNIAKHYTELMGGTISFESKLNEGTTFCVELPINNNE
ncbi:PAS domain S-box protein [Winogradskyella thalassocola]|uniref:histidine kinase n=1 Tax=Winogradskyella thalassocola TaxID=262004 RepID=A0A1G8JHZ5_9FLAO|nr:PAS domain S-box protein [Winogradskyella thalassocola]SDI30711.1 PAS domain S-box-containing protein [Winogradskyella thalassocola]